MQYITSGQVDDWRYRGEEDVIMTAVFKCQYLWGIPQPSDDIYALAWKSIDELTDYNTILKTIVPEHVEFIVKVIESFGKEVTGIPK